MEPYRGSWPIQTSPFRQLCVWFEEGDKRRSGNVIVLDAETVPSNWEKSCAKSFGWNGGVGSILNMVSSESETKGMPCCLTFISNASSSFVRGGVVVVYKGVVFVALFEIVMSLAVFLMFLSRTREPAS